MIAMCAAPVGITWLQFKLSVTVAGDAKHLQRIQKRHPDRGKYSLEIESVVLKPFQELSLDDLDEGIVRSSTARSPLIGHNTVISVSPKLSDKV